MSDTSRAPPIIDHFLRLKEEVLFFMGFGRRRVTSLVDCSETVVLLRSWDSNNDFFD
jgi:hypothetical protein